MAAPGMGSTPPGTPGGGSPGAWAPRGGTGRHNGGGRQDGAWSEEKDTAALDDRFSRRNPLFGLVHPLPVRTTLSVMSDDLRLRAIGAPGDSDPEVSLESAEAETNDMHRSDIDALKDGAAMLTQAGNRVAALAVMWSAVA